MIRLIVIDRQLRILRPNEKFPSFSCSQLLCMLAKSVIVRLCNFENPGFISVCDTTSLSPKGSLGAFSSDISSLHSAIDHIEQTAKVMFPSELTATSILNILKEAYLYYGPWSNIQVNTMFIFIYLTVKITYCRYLSWMTIKHLKTWHQMTSSNFVSHAGIYVASSH
ncbi:unnamed protein product [Schistosoma mattheei]|uniref:Uncharacterized protein n=1 Tax=Schistosoma mattheei TaxID=31246 RepID=A0A183PPK8_9TREM|nr:unnamed protein product [Schistosoma mattheei]